MVTIHSPKIALDEIWAALAEVPDPEMPFVNLVEMGIVRDVDWVDEPLRVIITPPFAACPAYEVMGANIKDRLHQLSIENVEIHFRHSPSWTSEWITDPNQYEMNGQWVDMTIVEENILVAGDETVDLPVRITEFGPIISESFGDLADFDQTSGLELPGR